MEHATAAKDSPIPDTGERILPAAAGEISYVYTRHRFAYEYIQPFAVDKEVIDVGCGSGYGSHLLAQTARRVVGIDQDVDAIAYCRAHFSAPNLSFTPAEALSLQLPDVFDMAVCLQVIEHLTDVAGFLHQLKSLVKPGGRIYLSTPNVRKRFKGTRSNPYHHSEMNYDQFSAILQNHFQRFDLLGVAYARRNRLRSILAGMPFYQWGRYLKRSSKIKKIAGRALDLTQFQVIGDDVAQRAADLLAVCYVT